MSSVCAEQHKFHPSHQLLSSKKTLFRDNNLDIPPRKLLTRRTTQELIPSSDIYSSPPDPYSPRFSAADETLLSKFLPYNTGASDDEDDAASDPYSSDHFRMFEFKVRRCTRSRSHDWTDCPFAHPGEKARRRDPRRHHYSGTVCADYRRGSCSRDDGCEFAHGVFECWLHPARYRTEACKDGKNCKRKVCFFAHTPRQLRVLPVNQSSDHQVLSPTPNMSSKKKFHLNSAAGSNKRCCLFCHSVTTSSPTSTLLGMSHISPPMSPAANAPIMSRSGGGLGMGLGLDQMHAGAGGMFMSYKDALAELMTSLEAMKFNEAAASSSPVSPNNMNCSNFAAANPNSHRWVDVSFNVDHQDHQQQFILSPSTPSPSPSAGRGNFFNRDEYCSPRKSSAIDNDPINVDSGSGTGSDPDLGWVNDLLM